MDLPAVPNTFTQEGDGAPVIRPMATIAEQQRDALRMAGYGSLNGGLPPDPVGDDFRRAVAARPQVDHDQIVESFMPVSDSNDTDVATAGSSAPASQGTELLDEDSAAPVLDAFADLTVQMLKCALANAPVREKYETLMAGVGTAINKSMPDRGISLQQYDEKCCSIVDNVLRMLSWSSAWKATSDTDQQNLSALMRNVDDVIVACNSFKTKEFSCVTDMETSLFAIANDAAMLSAYAHYMRWDNTVA